MKHTIGIITLLVMLLMGVTVEAWALSATDIKIDILPAEAKTAGCTVIVNSIGSDGKTVTITATPTSEYYVTKENVVAYLLVSPSSAAPRRAVPISDPLTISGPDGIQMGATEYSFVVPEDYAGAQVTVTFTPKGVATAVVKANDLVYNQKAQALFTVTNVEGGIVKFYKKDGETYTEIVEATGIGILFEKKENSYEEVDVSAGDPEDLTAGLASGKYIYFYIPKETNANETNTDGTYQQYAYYYYKIIPNNGYSAEDYKQVKVTIKKAKLTGVTLANTVVNVGDVTSTTFAVSKLHSASMTFDSPSAADYDVTGNMETAQGIYTAKVTGKGNFEGTVTAKYEIVEGTVVLVSSSTSASEITALNGHYILKENIVDPSVFENLKTGTFTGTFDGGMFTIGSSTNKLTHPLFAEIGENAIVRNVNFKGVNITSGTNVGAVAGVATGNSRIYNCGILPVTATYDDNGNVTGFTGNSITGSKGVGSIVGKIEGTTHVINCFSYATLTGGNDNDSYVAGIVGNNTVSSTTKNYSTPATSELKTVVVNCMFYGEIEDGKNVAPVFGNKSISNADANGINLYDYFRESSSFDNGFTKIDQYKCCWPAKEEYLTRFEYYRSILNANRQLCTYWVTDKGGTTQTDDDVALIAKWVLDPEIAPYPVLKKWDKYPSVINPNPEKTWNPTTKLWVNRSTANEYEGKRLGSLTVNVKAGDHGSGTKTLSIPIMDMDTLNCDYGYAKVQLPYYNEQFGDPTSSDWDTRYGGNYKEYVVTGWMITSVSGGTDITNTAGVDEYGIAYDHTFVKDWESGYNFADRYCTDKDLYDVSGRVFAQGGYYYVPEGVTSITITAKWGKAVYLRNTDNYIDRVNVTSSVGHGSPFSPAGTLSANMPFQINNEDVVVKTSLREAIKALGNGTSLSVYDQAIVLVGNYQKRNGNDAISYSIDNKWHPFTIMSADFNMDNEPDYCMQWQFRNNFDRPPIQPIRFDFLPVAELGLAIRPNKNPYTIGIFIPQGHFEITETAYMHTTQFEYDADITRMETESPLILNGGQFEQIVVRRGDKNRTKYILMGGNVWMNRFTPGYHASPVGAAIRHCAVSVNGGEYPEFYLSGIYAPSFTVKDNDNPHCYINGGRFGFIAGAGYEQIKGDVTFKIDHSIIEEFYGGGINGSKPVTGNIDVTIDNSVVWKYCGGPKVGPMTKVSGKRKTVTTHAKGTVFYKFFGGGNGGTSFYREKGYDGNSYDLPKATTTAWLSSSLTKDLRSYAKFNPLNTLTNGTTTPVAYDNGTDISSTGTKDNKGYHALFEFEVFNESNGLGDKPTIRLYTHWAQFGTTITGDVNNTLIGCKVKGDFYGGGNLGNVEGDVKSILTDTEVGGSAFGAGYSAAIPSFRIHDKSSAVFPYVDVAGVMHNGKLTELDVEYTWTNEQPSGIDKTKPYFKGTDNKWYCWTWESLDNLGAVSGKSTITINGSSKINGNVFGGGDASGLEGNSEVNIEGSAIIGSVNSQGKLAEGSGDVYGGGNKANVSGNTKVILLGGTINGDAYGGGKGQLAAAAVGTEGEEGYKPAVTAVAAKVGATTVYLNGMEKADYTDDKYGSLGLIRASESENAPYIVGGSKSGCIVNGRIFGCNNLNGSPLDNATVHIYKTAGASRTRKEDLDNIDDSKHHYHIQAVYGGGNLAAYIPYAADATTHVIIDGCDMTSIRQVYGGGNAASTPATKVEVNGTYEIEELFGGGNGKDPIGEGKPNPGANVGYYDYSKRDDNGIVVVDDNGLVQEKNDAMTVAQRQQNYQYGTGEANVKIYGGLVHRVFGGSNTLGNVRKTALTLLDGQEDCEFKVDEAYGGGKSAPMDGAAHLEMACIPGLKAAYGGAEEANILNDVTLNITNGTFDRVFGGNNVQGTISGKITVNIEETGCRPIIIGQLYGGGNQAPYTASDGETGPTLNIRSFTSIGDVFGGGYGKTAVVTGNTTVDINVCEGKFFDKETEKDLGKTTIRFTEYERKDNGDFVLDDEGNRVPKTVDIDIYQPPHAAGQIGAINNVFGGGNAARVIGNTNVNIGTKIGEQVNVVSLPIKDSANREPSDPNWEPTYTMKEVKGVNIVGNVYGGGNEAEVTGSTNVTIGKETTTTTTSTPAPPVTPEPAEQTTPANP